MGKKSNGNGTEPQKMDPQSSKLIGTFGINKVVANAQLEDWLNAEGSLQSWEQHVVDEVFLLSQPRVRDWNEEELKMKLVSLVFFLAKLEVEGKIATFYERPLSQVFGKHKLSVVCDCLIASPFGLTEPEKPYFFLQEYKKGKGDIYDPEGQMLAAMLIAQKMNADQQPVFGGWIMGNIWYFAILDGINYCTSDALSTLNKAELTQIIFILRKLKAFILKRP